MLTAEETGIYGLPADRQYQMNTANGQISAIGGSGVNVTTNVESPQTGASPKLEGLIDEQLAGYMQQAAVSSAAIPQLQMLQQLAPLTTEGQIPAQLSRMFPTMNEANSAFIGITNQVLPSLRVPGSGAQSDKDIDVLLNSIGSLAATAEVKQLLVGSLMAKNQINQQLADITQQVIDGEITRSDATRQIRQIQGQSIIPPELSRMLEGMGSSPVPASAASAGVTAEDWSMMTPAEKAAFR
jgi:hypothetical protein